MKKIKNYIMKTLRKQDRLSNIFINTIITCLFAMLGLTLFGFGVAIKELISYLF
jgi:predicted Ser/Thr protein kinase